MTPQPAPGRLTTRQIAWDALVLLRQSFDAAWPWWFALFVLETGNAARTVLMTPPLAPGHPVLAPGPLAVGLTLALGLAGTLLGAFALRSMIAGRREPVRLDVGLGAYVALSFAAQAVWTLIAMFASPLAERAMAYPPPAKPPTELMPMMLGALAVFAVLAFVFARLALWPVGKLVGDKAMGAAESWRRMKGAVWPLIAASLILVLPVALAGDALLSAAQTPTLPLAASPLLGLMTSLSAALDLAVRAAVWRARSRLPAVPAVAAPATSPPEA